MVIDPKKIYALTRKGRGELSSAATSLSGLDLELLVLIDSRASVARMVATLASRPESEVLQAVRRLHQAGLIAESEQAEGAGDGIEASGFFARPLLPESPDAAAAAASESAQTLALLRQHGYVARIAKRAAQARKPGKQIHVLVVEDDEQLAKLLRMFLGMHEYVPRIAGNRDSIVAALRQAPVPDVVLLDVSLPDIDGFDVLARLKQHAALKSVPVIMMTGKATREAVLKGLVRGADGYITKPFNVDVISQAVQSVLGLR